MKTLLLKNASALLPDGKAENVSVLIGNGKILEISPGGGLSSSDEEIDVSNTTLFAGFIDIHIHGAVGIDTNEADADALHKAARFLAKNGVCAWLPTLVPDSKENYLRSIQAVGELISTQDESEPAARVLGVHYEGPYVSEKQCGALHAEFFKTFAGGDDLKFLPRLKNPGAVHLTTLAPEVEGGVELIKGLVKEGWVVSIGHTRAGVDILEQALKAGARHMTHFMNAMSPLHHRQPGPIGWGLLNDGVSLDVIADGVHVDPLMLRLILRCKTSARISLISDAVAPAGLGDGEYNIWGETISVTRGRTSNARGSIAGSVITLLEAVRLMLSLGVPAEDVARMASSNPARLLGVDQDCGSLEVGKRADLTALDAEGNVRLTLIGGRVAFDNI
jgi:N-acetylglucosamine-6-phosphate deacetylase